MNIIQTESRLSRTSAVYGAFLFIGNFALGAMRAYIPSLAVMSIFGGIVLDVVCIASVTLLFYRLTCCRQMCTTGPRKPKIVFQWLEIFTNVLQFCQQLDI